jgi:hypothetical protein
MKLVSWFEAELGEINTHRMVSSISLLFFPVKEEKWARSER